MKKLNQSGIVHIAAIVIVILLAGLGFAGYRVYTLQNKLDDKKENTKQTEANKDSTKTTSSVPEGFLEYTNNEYGFTFAYPKEWGKATFSDNACDAELVEIGVCTGSYAGVTFDATNKADAKVISVSMVTDDGSSVKDGFRGMTKGYEVRGGKVYSKENKETLDDAVIKQSTHGQYVYENARSADGVPGTKIYFLYAGINLTKNPKYKGLQVYTDSDMSEADFFKIMNTFKVFK